MKIKQFKLILYICYYVLFHILIENITTNCVFIEDHYIFNDLYRMCSRYQTEYNSYIDFESFENFNFSFKKWEIFMGIILYEYYIM